MNTPEVITVFDHLHTNAKTGTASWWGETDEALANGARQTVQAVLKAAEPFADLFGKHANTINDPITEHARVVRMSDVHALRMALIDARGFV
ncbi:hypothetical protein EO087_01730 [Dyella sp. M7H15-1]|uniref:hypothetical protein n=1 Tax=Dyella sp. M7H15-1 TaxID=2501295 RepID=UPI001004F29B|nr:hypothetical protein [Dyella sp. M7H15-1]QAU22863.1 hypothetical protein EO087_01730 [Dyella sp. M7H15-1]